MSGYETNAGQVQGETAPPCGAITTFLSRLNLGDRKAFDELVPLVYEELHRIAQAYLRRESSTHTLQPTSLIHEAYMRLAEGHAEYEGREHFFGIAARVMRQILVDHARGRAAAKRGAAVTVALDRDHDCAPERERALLSLDDALNTLAREDNHKARLVEMRFFGGMTAQEIADCIGAPVHVVRRELRNAQIRLRREIEQ